MKKTNYLFLLVPSLFLITSCQTTPHVDTITEAEARTFIHEHYQDVVAKIPTATSKVKWEIKDNDKKNEAKQIIYNYIIGGTLVNPDEFALKNNQGQAIENEERRQQYYTSDLASSEPMGVTSTDAVVAMNEDIYNKLYTSTQNEPQAYHLYYKHGPDNGLIIVSDSDSTTSVHRRTHTYNHLGLETEYKVEFAKDDIIYTMTINFNY